jgi:hypothetical protein
VPGDLDQVLFATVRRWLAEDWPFSRVAWPEWIEHQTQNLVLDPTRLVELPALLIIRLIIQTIRRDPSRSDAVDEAPNVSRADPSGADQIDAEHQATDLAVASDVPQFGILSDGRCGARRWWPAEEDG